MEGNKWFSSALLRSEVRGQAGDPIDIARLINQNPLRKVNVAAEKSATVGDADLILRRFEVISASSFLRQPFCQLFARQKACAGKGGRPYGYG